MKYRIVTAQLDGKIWGFEAELLIKTTWYGKEVWQRVPFSFELTDKDCQQKLFKLKTGIIVF